MVHPSSVVSSRASHGRDVAWMGDTISRRHAEIECVCASWCPKTRTARTFERLHRHLPWCGVPFGCFVFLLISLPSRQSLPLCLLVDTGGGDAFFRHGACRASFSFSCATTVIPFVVVEGEEEECKKGGMHAPTPVSTPMTSVMGGTASDGGGAPEEDEEKKRGGKDDGDASFHRDIIEAYADNGSFASSGVIAGEFTVGGGDRVEKECGEVEGEKVEENKGGKTVTVVRGVQENGRGTASSRWWCTFPFI